MTTSITKIEKSILDEFKSESQHLREQPVTDAMQEELAKISLPFHLKFQELGYQWNESLLLLRKAFDHKPPRNKKPQPLSVFG